MDIEQIGTRLTNYRKMKNLTIKDFSKVSGISTALLSQLERGIGNPSLSVLDSIARTMNISISTLFEDQVSLEKLVKRVEDQGYIKDSRKSNIEFQLLTKKSTNLSADLFRITLYPHTETPLVPFGVNELEELILVEKGTLTVCTENKESVVLKKGDTIRFIPRMSYKLENNSAHNVSVLYFASNTKEVLWRINVLFNVWCDKRIRQASLYKN